MQTITIDRPPEIEGDGEHDLHRYVAVIENAEQTFMCIFVLNAADERECRKLIARWFLRTKNGIPRNCTIVPVSDNVEWFNITSNDDEVCEHLGIDTSEERT